MMGDKFLVVIFTSRCEVLKIKMLEGTLSVYAFILIFPLAVIGGLIFLIRNFIRTTEYYDADARFDGKTIVVTGGSSGLGRTLSVELARRGARVIVACRTKARRDSTAFFLRSKTGSFNVRTMFMDLTSLDSVYDFCQELVDTEEKIDAVVNNAAILCPQDKTSDELDMMLGVNYLGHLLLTELVTEKLLSHGTSSSPARIVNVVCGSMRSGHIVSDDEMEGKATSSCMREIYRSSKLAMHLMTRELSHKHAEAGVVAFSADPGYVNTGLYKHLEGPLGKFNQTCAKALYRTTEEGIQTILYCLGSKDVLKDSGRLFKDCRPCDVRNAEWTEKATKDLFDRASRIILTKGIKMQLGADDEEDKSKADSEE